LQIKLRKLEATKFTVHFFVKTCKLLGQTPANFVKSNFKPVMHITNDNRLKKLIVIGDRVLIKPTKPDERTASGLYLPPGVQEKEKVQQGYIIKTGPGYVIPMPPEDESWKQEEDKIKYVPLQAKEGDLAIFLLSGATEIIYQDEKYFIVPQSAILMLEREEDL
jgi:chaperonin GroES